MTTLIMMTILLFGVVSYWALPVSDLPNVDFPTIQVTASQSGANPETMASAVATPLEKEFSTIAGVDSMDSTSSSGTTRITLQFALSRNIDAAAQDVQSAIARAARNLPTTMTTPPYYRKVNPADDPFLWLALTSPNLPMSALDEYGQTLIAQRVSMVNGVAQVLVYGSQKYAVRIQVDPRELAVRGIGIDEVTNAVANSNVNLPLGILDGPHRGATIQANGQLLQAASYMPLIVAYRNDQAVRVQDLGKAIDSVEVDKIAAWFTNEGHRDRSIVLALQRQPGTNTVAVADAVKKLLPYFREQLPASVTLDVLRDTSLSIRESAEDMQFTLLLTLGLVVMVIFLFLRNISATVIPSLTLPMAVIGTFVVMYLLDYSLDNLSLMAMTLSVGFVVDDAIVMLENIVRHGEMGKDRRQAAFDGAQEIGFTIVSMTLSLAAVFIPVLFMGGLIGRLFREFSVTIGAAVLVSGFISLTLTPMLCSRFLKEPRNIHHGAAYRATEAVFQLLLRAYGWSLSGALNHRRLTMLMSATILAATVYLAMIVPKGFLPAEDRDFIRMQTEAGQDVSFEYMKAHQLALSDIVQADPNVVRFMSTAAGGNSGRMGIMLKPRRERKASAAQVVENLRGRLATVPGIRAMVAVPPSINLGGRQTKSQYQLTLQGPNTAELYAYGGELEGKIRELPDFRDVISDMQLKNPQLTLQIDRDQAFILGVTPFQIEDALYTAYGDRQVSTIYAPNNQYQVILTLLPKYQTDASVLSMLYIRSSKGDLVPLQAVASLKSGVGPMLVNHSGQLPSVTISFDLRPGVSLGAAVEQVQTIMRGNTPDGISASFQGSAQAFKTSLNSMGFLLILAIVVIYVVLGILYESFYHPITILSALPFAGFGALLTLWAFDAELSIYAYVGIIMLVGLVKKNGIMMVDFALETQRTQGKSPMEAIHEACMVRFRPITMTTMAALMGGIPLALGYGAGGETRKPLGLAVVGGLLFSQSLTLFVTPVFYVYMEKIAHLFHRKKAPAVETPGLPGDDGSTPPPETILVPEA
jgi:HAE1 family hydrophobic/amphiphilic exporter-1